MKNNLIDKVIKRMNLVVLTKQFGMFTGATVSTIEILKRISKDFDSVKVLTLKSQKVTIPNVKVIVAKNYIDLLRKLKKEKNVLGYSDDHLGFLFYLAKVRYIHTYHGNWPDARWLSIEMFLKSLVFIPMYKLTIKRASKVVSVSEYMEKRFVDKFTKKSIVIFNGVKQKSNLSVPEINYNNRFIMVGNLDKRKYKKSIPIFKILNQLGFNGKIDIYGEVIDKSLADRLGNYSFVTIKGVVENIDFNMYEAMICTSSSENLPVSIVEATLNGIFVISFNVGGINEIVPKNINGKLFNENNYYDFAKEIMSKRRRQISYSLIQHNANKFNWDNSSVKYEKLFRKLME